MGKQITTTDTEIKSEFFSLAELTRSDTAERHKIDNAPNKAIIDNLQYGVDMVLDPLRRLYGKPIKINSGFRCEQLNKLVGGVTNSWHQVGNAADIHISSAEEAKILFSNLQKLPSVDTILFEHSKTAQWLHVQWDKTRTPRHHYNFNYKA
jgi:zinc D-Ala-D-Ala carboxypeptidase